MALLRAEAEKLSNNQLVAGVIEEIIEKDETFAMLPFVQVNGKAYVYDRENALATAAFIAVADAVPESATTFTEVTAKLRILIGDVDVDKFLDETMSDTNSQKATQIAFKAKAVARKFKQTLATGDSGADVKVFDGLAVLVAAGQTIYSGAAGVALSLSQLDDLADMVPMGADAFIMRPSVIRAWRALVRAAGGNDAAIMMIDNFGQPVPAHNGIPILRNDFLAINETRGASVGVCTSVYAVRFNEVDGLHGLYGGANAGIRVEDIGTVQDKDVTRTRLKWYCGTALKSTKSLARLGGVTNI